MHDPLSNLPNQRGSGRYSNLRTEFDELTEDEENEAGATISTAGIKGWSSSKPITSMARVTGISVPLPAHVDSAEAPVEALSSSDAAFLDDDLVLDSNGILRNPIAVAPEAIISHFEAIGSDGSTYWQDLPTLSRPDFLPAQPIFPLTGPPKTPREGRLANPVGWDGAHNFTDAQAKAFRKVQKRVQKALVDDAAAAAIGVNQAMFASGSAPKILYRNDFRAINATKGDPWHGIHRSRHLKRCDQTLFCIRCCGASSGNRTPWMQKPCIPNGPGTKNELFKHKKDTVDRRLLKGSCPYRCGKWRSGLHK